MRLTRKPDDLMWDFSLIAVRNEFAKAAVHLGLAYLQPTLHSLRHGRGVRRPPFREADPVRGQAPRQVGLRCELEAVRKTVPPSNGDQPPASRRDRDGPPSRDKFRRGRDVGGDAAEGIAAESKLQRVFRRALGMRRQSLSWWAFAVATTQRFDECGAQASPPSRSLASWSLTKSSAVSRGGARVRVWLRRGSTMFRTPSLRRPRRDFETYVCSAWPQPLRRRTRM